MKLNNKLSKKDNIEVVLKSALITAIQTLIPPVGSFIANVINEYSYKNIENFIKIFNEDISKIKNISELIQRQDKKYFTTIFIEIIEKIKLEFIEEKIKYFKIYFLNTIKNPINEENYNKRSFYLEVLKNIDILEIKLLQMLYYSHPNKIIVEDIFKKFSIEEPLIKSFIEKLKFYGLIEKYKTGWSFGGTDISKNNEIIITDIGKKFCDFCIKD